ncbi:MAG: hypothetical protein ABSA75_06280 [Candidatus Bathyarchaeia archaeon]
MVAALTATADPLEVKLIILGRTITAKTARAQETLKITTTTFKGLIGGEIEMNEKL